MDKRTCGILLSITSLPSKYGIGTLGEKAYQFIDFLCEAKQTYWQILPLGPTSYGDSPYQTFSAFAGNPYFIDLDILIQEKLLTVEDLSTFDLNFDPEKVDFEKIYQQRFKILKLAYQRFSLTDRDYQTFLTENEWIHGYALFMTLKEKFDGHSWTEWPDEFKYRDRETISLFQKEHVQDIQFWKFIQYKFFEQWNALKQYANGRGIKLIGDMAIYVANDSADVWLHPENYVLDQKLNPIEVAGCPPDAFTEDGQLWGNPLYNWEYLDKNNYQFWIQRTRIASQMFDLTRIDHFRGFAGYYSIPFGDKNAKKGKWNVGPGIKLFNAIKRELGEIPIIAEDLGFITEDVKELLKETNFPGMKLICFGFGSGSDNDHLPHNYHRNMVCYAGTHDNAPINGWKKTLNKAELDHCLEYLQTDYENICWDMIREIYKSVANYAIITMQDILELDEKARFNIPSTLGNNWVWRMREGALTGEIIHKLKHLAEFYNRF